MVFNAAFHRSAPLSFRISKKDITVSGRYSSPFLGEVARQLPPVLSQIQKVRCSTFPLTRGLAQKDREDYSLKSDSQHYQYQDSNLR